MVVGERLITLLGVIAEKLGKRRVGIDLTTVGRILEILIGYVLANELGDIYAGV